MPDYSKLAVRRDFYGEMGWIPNFDVKISKDNDKRYTACREFFDAPIEFNATNTLKTISANIQDLPSP